MLRLLALFILVPALELVLLIEVGSRIGTFETLSVIVVTGVVGAFYARQQGLGVLRTLQQQLGSGELPAESIGDGALILVAGALLMTPGFLTDAFGFLCLIPTTRAVMRRIAWRQLRRFASSGRVRVDVGAGPGAVGGPSQRRVDRDDVRFDPGNDVTDLQD